MYELCKYMMVEETNFGLRYIEVLGYFWRRIAANEFSQVQMIANANEFSDIYQMSDRDMS